MIKPQRVCLLDALTIAAAFLQQHQPSTCQLWITLAAEHFGICLAGVQDVDRNFIVSDISAFGRRSRGLEAERGSKQCCGFDFWSIL